MENTFERKVRIKFIYYFCLLAVGLITLILRGKGIYTSDAYIGLGCGILAVSLLKIFQWNAVLRNPEKRVTAKLQQTDERNIFIAKQAYAGFTSLSILFQFILILAVGIFAPQYGEILAYVLSGNALLLSVCFLYYRKKY